jgi:crossover junction endodeoxyribonuclease RuvC
LSSVGASEAFCLAAELSEDSLAHIELQERNVAIGVDIGLCGAVAILDANGGLIAVHDMPCLDGVGAAGRRAISAPLLADIVFKSHASRAFVERVGARPGEGPVGAFAFGYSAGVVAGVLASAGIPATLLTPPGGKRLVGITRGSNGAKAAALSEAIRRWPDKAAWFARVKDDGRAEAALIAVAGLLREAAR